MKRRNFLTGLPFIAAGVCSCDAIKEQVIKRKKTFVLNTEEILKKSVDVGILEGANLYRYPSNGDSVNLLIKGIDNRTIYDISKYDSLKFGETNFKYGGKTIYGILEAFKK